MTSIIEINESWDLVQSALDELAEDFGWVTRLGSDADKQRFKAETYLLMARTDELIGAMGRIEHG
jgi:hypothetical protein